MFGRKQLQNWSVTNNFLDSSITKNINFILVIDYSVHVSGGISYNI